MYLLLAVAYLHIACEILPLIPFSNVSNISTSVNSSNSTLVIFKHACHAKPGADTKYVGSNRYIFMHVSRKFSKIPASCRASD